jgi:serine/threonine-protein kinase
MASDPTLTPGTLVAGKLRIVRLLGQGGMGAVYEVEHEFTKHRRALKLLHPEMIKHEHIVARFLREASAAGRIGNKHIVESFDAGTLESGEPYLVMELLDGESLDTRLQRDHTLPVEEIADLLAQACDGVQAAHDAGIVHRDLKPENLFTVRGKDGPLVKLLDFGISRFDPTLTGAHAVTREGSMLGTPYYMSPEQVEGDKDLDARSDIYALGVVLYECASGRRPFEASAMPKLAVLIHEGKPTPLAELRPDLPAGFAEVVARAMARDREARFATARELRNALARFGSAALGETIDEIVAHRASSRPPSSTQRPIPRPEASKPKGLTPSVAGAAVSVARERPARTLGLAAALAAVVVSSLGGWLLFMGPKHATATVATAPPSPPAPVPPPTSAAPVATDAPSSAPSTPRAAASASAAPSGQPQEVARRVPVVPATPASGATRSPKPTASTRADQRGLAADNPY